MADEKLNMGSAENTSPKAAEPIATPEQATASELRQEQTGPAIPEPSDVVVSFDKINELMVEKRQNTCAEAEKAAIKKQNKNAVYCFMDKKRSEGKHYYVYTVAGSAKFLWVYCTRVTEFLRPQSSSDAG